MKNIAAIIKYFKPDDVRTVLTDADCRARCNVSLQMKKQRIRTGEKNEEAIK